MPGDLNMKRSMTRGLLVALFCIISLCGCGSGDGGETTPQTAQYTITPSAGTGGAITPSGIQTVNSGSNISFTITPDAGYYVADVIVDNISKGTIKSYTFNNVTMNHTIGVTFTTDPTAAELKIATQGTLPSGTQIYGIDITIVLPTGMSVKSVTTPPETDSGVVVASGVAAANSTVLSTYTPATSLTTGKVRVLLANSIGFGTGEFMTVHCDIASGSTTTTSDFSVSDFVAKDLNGVAISGLIPEITTTFQ
jgi:hypothetical protein